MATDQSLIRNFDAIKTDYDVAVFRKFVRTTRELANRLKDAVTDSNVTGNESSFDNIYYQYAGERSSRMNGTNTGGMRSEVLRALISALTNVNVPFQITESTVSSLAAALGTRNGPSTARTYFKTPLARLTLPQIPVGVTAMFVNDKCVSFEGKFANNVNYDITINIARDMPMSFTFSSDVSFGTAGNLALARRFTTDGTDGSTFIVRLAFRADTALKVYMNMEANVLRVIDSDSRLDNIERGYKRAIANGLIQDAAYYDTFDEYYTVQTSHLLLGRNNRSPSCALLGIALEAYDIIEQALSIN